MRNDIVDLFNKLDSTTYNHSIRVMQIAMEIENYYKLSDSILSEAGLIHDIGKVFISSKILDKIGSLNEIERNLINLHPYIGYKLLRDFGVNEEVCRIVLYHHGKNPIILEDVGTNINELKLNKIYDRSLMLHSIDSFEALTSDRSYHRGYLAEEALSIMQNENHHHPLVLDYLKYMLDNSNKIMISNIFRNSYQTDIGDIESTMLKIISKIKIIEKVS